MMGATDPFNLVGTIVDGRYRVEKVAGQGGFGIVYRAFHLAFESPVALKVLKLPRGLDASTTGEALLRFKREGKVLFELCSLHPSIVKATETGAIASSEHGALPYLALEWLEGVSLDQELKYRRQLGIAPMTLPEVLALLDEPAAAMAVAHERGVAHRDLKPSNLFVSFQGRKPVVKILDFGIAKILDVSASASHQFETTGAAPSSFTPMYGAPEQWLRRLGATGAWTDVHAWALVCLELLIGQPALAGDDSAQFMAASLDTAVRPTPASMGLAVAPEVEAAFAKAVAIDPRDRFSNLGEFWWALTSAVAATSAPDGASRSFPTLHATSTVEKAPPVVDEENTSRPSSTSLPAPTAPTQALTAIRPRGFVTPLRAFAAAGILVTLGVSLKVTSRRGDSATEASPTTGATATVVVAAAAGPAPIPTVPPPIVLSTGDTMARTVDASEHHNPGAARRNATPEPVVSAIAAPPAQSSVPPSLSASAPRPPRSLDQLLQDEELVHRR
jgi:serine/threonine-protein kinase